MDVLVTLIQLLLVHRSMSRGKIASVFSPQTHLSGCSGHYLASLISRITVIQESSAILFFLLCMSCPVLWKEIHTIWISGMSTLTYSNFVRPRRLMLNDRLFNCG